MERTLPPTFAMLTYLLEEPYMKPNSPLLDNVRLMCRKVAEEAAFVRIDAAALQRYAASLPLDRLTLPQMDPAIHYLGHGRDTVAYFLTLDAVNFGSGYFPDIFKDPGRSGYRAVAAALADYFAAQGALAPGKLLLLNALDCARIFRQDRRDPSALELMGLFARALNDLGAFLCEHFNGDFQALLEEAGGRAERLVEILTAMPFFNDVAPYRGMTVPFYKRAQLAAVDLFIAFGGTGPGRFYDMDRVTICADNLVPHVLRMDGILQYQEGLLAGIEGGEPIAASSPEEVEIRACAVYAGELIVAELRRREERVNAMMLDNFLWHRGQEPSYRVHPRHRTRTCYY